MFKREVKMKVVNLVKAALFVLTLAASSANAALIVTFSPSSTNISVGDTFTVDVLATTQNPLVDGFVSFDIGFLFDNSIVTFDSSPTALGFLPVASGFGGAAGFAPLPIPVSGIDILLATLTFTAISDGSFFLNVGPGLFVGLSPFPGQGSLPTSGFISFSGVPLSISVAKANVSAPATLGLFGLSALMLLMRRKA